MVTNVCAKSNYDQSCIDKALGFRKSDKSNNKNKSRTTLVAIEDPSGSNKHNNNNNASLIYKASYGRNGGGTELATFHLTNSTICFSVAVT